MLRGLTALTLLLLAGGAAAGQVVPLSPQLHGDLTYDLTTGEAVLTNHPSVIYGDTLLLADEFRYNQAQNLITGIGNFTVTSGSERLLADRGTYNLATGAFTLTRVRAGEPPYFIQGASAAGTRARMTITDAVVTYNEPGSFAPTLTARELTYEPGQRFAGVHGHLDLGDLALLPLPSFSESVKDPLVSRLTGRAGFRRNLGAFVDLGLHAPVWPGFNLGGDVGVFTARGVLLGPGGDYRFQSGDDTGAGAFSTGYIRDGGDRKTDLLGRPIGANRAFIDWSHRQTVGDRWTLTGQVNWWQDSEILRDFRPNQFYPVQQPDTFLEAAYAGDNYFLSAFTRLDPNNFEIVQQRLPEIRFDLLPTPIGGGFDERFNSSFAALQEDSLFSGPTLRSDRFDAYYALERPIAVTDWLNVTPVAGGRLTYYAKAVGGRNDYTRGLGELGVDADLRASGVFNYRNSLWGIDGLRHLLTPRLSYRYIPEADRGQAYIPPIDRTVFSTNLEPIDLGSIRNIDQLHGIHTLRLGLDNVLQTRDAHYGSRDLAALDLASDFNFSTEPGRHRWSDVYTDLSLTPARWLRFDLYQRVSARTFKLHELNTSFELLNSDWWTLRLSTVYLQNQLEEYFVEYQRRLNEVWRAFARVRYDARLRRWDEVSYGLRQNLKNTWNIRYELAWTQGNQRESSFGVSVAIDLIRF